MEPWGILPLLSFPIKKMLTQRRGTYPFIILESFFLGGGGLCFSIDPTQLETVKEKNLFFFTQNPWLRASLVAQW